jgi:hypothetical protein
MLKSRANLIEQLIPDDQRTGLAYGEKPRFEVRQEPLLHHFSSSFLSEHTQNRSEGARAALFAVLVENVSGSQPGSRKEPDQHSSTISLWIATTDQRLS